MTTLSVAVVGSGPAGLYTAEALVKQSAALEAPCRVSVDGLDRLVAATIQRLRDRYAPFDHPGAREILAWLDGAYRITPEMVRES